MQRYGSLKVVTTKMKPGYLRKNGVPYSENATVTEYFDRHKESNGDQWLTVTTLVDDPKYLNQTVHHELALQEGTGRIEVATHAVRRPIAPPGVPGR